MTPQKIINKITKNLDHIAKKTKKGATLTKKHKAQIKKALGKLYTAASDLEKVALVLE